MNLNIQWQDDVQEKTQITIVSTVAGCLLVYRHHHLITRTEWSLNAGNEHDESEFSQRIQSYINARASRLNVELYRQGTEFRNKVWREIVKIPAGQVMSYGQIANNIESGARAVANACRDNPFPGLIPCHRVVAANGLGGYMGVTCGYPLDIKKKLLQVEAAYSISRSFHH